MEKITLNEYLKQGSVVENLKNFVGVTPENTVGLMTPERLAAVAGEPLLKSVSINLVPNQIIDIQMYSGGLLLLSQSNSTCVVMLGGYQSNRGEFLSSYVGGYKLFVKDTPDKINIYADSTGWHIQNSKSSNMTVVYRLIQIKSRWD